MLGMTVRIEGRVFSAHPYRLPDLVEDLELRRCTFETCQHPLQRTADDRPTIRGVSLVRCHVSASDLGAVIAEDCLVDTIWFHRGMWGSQMIAGCALRHVTIRGNVSGGLEFLAAGLYQPDAERAALLAANGAYYADVDWALDISDARFTSVSFVRSDIPARLIRRDPATQVVVTRRRLLGADWQGLLGNAAVAIGIDRFMETGSEDTVLVASKRSRRFAQEMAVIDRLRVAGLVEAD
jgi:hypothetical protein